MTWGAMQSLASLNGRHERRDGAMIQEYLRTGGVNMNPADTAWCAAVVNSALTQSGMQGTGSNMARSFLNWGNPTNEPKPGDIAVFSRGDPNAQTGHVGFFQGYDDNGHIRVLGGNQGDAVNVSSFAPSGLLGFRTAGDVANVGPDMNTLNAAKAAGTATGAATATTQAPLDNYGKGMGALTKGLMGLAMASQAPQGGGLLSAPQMKAGVSGQFQPLRIGMNPDDPFNQFA